MRKRFLIPKPFTAIVAAVLCLLTTSATHAQPRPWMPPSELVFSAKGTGRTTGHIADLDVKNPGPRPRQFEIPASVIPSDGKHQGYTVPEPTPVTVPGNSTVTVPLQGFCTDPDLPPPSPGAPLTPINTWDTGSPLIPTIQNIIRTTTDLQQRGQIVTPFSNNPPRERESVIQQTLWWYSAPSTYDPCLRISSSLSSLRDTDWWRSNGPDVGQGIAQMADAITRVGRASNLPGFTAPPLPAAAALPTPAQPASHPNVASTIRVVGTGRTTGHIVWFFATNPTKDPITIRIGDGRGFLIPSSGNYQPYIVPSLPDIPVEPGQTVSIPVEGFCVDVRRPPVGAGEPMPPIQSWIGGSPVDAPTLTTAPTVPEPMNPPGAGRRTLVSIPTQTAPPLSQIADMLQNAPGPPASSTWNCPDLPVSGTPLVPGTNTPIRVPVNADAAPGIATPLLLEAINRVSQAYDELQPRGAINTPFSNNRDRERESVIQQTFWMYSAALEGEPYTPEDFHDNTVRQFESNTNRQYDNLPKEQKDKLDAGVDDFWNTFQAVGAEAKILPKVPDIEPRIDDFWNSFNDGGVKPRGTSSDPLSDGPRQTATEVDSPPELIQARQRREKPREKKCECGPITFEFQIWTWGKNDQGIDAEKGQPHKEPVGADSKPGLPAHSVTIKKGNLPALPARADQYLMAIRNVKTDCPCIEWTEAMEQASKDLDKLEKDNASKITKAKEALENAQKELDKKESDLAKEKAEKRPTQATIKRLTGEIEKAKEKKRKAEDALAELEKPINDQKEALAKSKTAAKKSDCPVYKDAKKTPSKLPDITVKGATTSVQKEPNSDEEYISFLHDPAKPIEYEITISFYCEGPDCKPVSCSRTFTVKVEN
ncbi:MAG: hypothetical protein KF852_05250 [Saprospiraceae bacterium]|nr:hypothetical protein [Saprospiraceae bacterium]